MAVLAQPRKTCCRSTPRCASCPVLLVRSPSRSGRPGGGIADVVAEIYGAAPVALPESIVQALDALASARAPRRARRRDAAGLR